MKIGFLGDVVGRPGREMIKNHLSRLKKEHKIDIIIANTENASHGFGLSLKNANELFDYGIDVMTGGNHSFDRKEIINLMDELPILRPINLPKITPGKGIIYIEKNNYKICIINLMGYFTMPMVDNPFICIENEIKNLEKCDGIFIDFHAEATSEKRALFQMLKDKVSGIIGTHTHVGTDDLVIENGCVYVTDVGLTGCRDNIIGVDSDGPIKRFTEGMHFSFDINNKCKKILQMIVFDLDLRICKDAFKIKVLEGYEEDFIQKAFVER